MVHVQFLGHSFFKVSYPNCNILFDPFINNTNKSKDFNRLVKCPVTEKQLKDIALIFVSHEHFDHFDKETIEKIAKRDKSTVVSSEHVLNSLNIPSSQKKPIDKAAEFKLRDLTIKAIPVHHPQAFYPMGFIVSDGAFSVFHAGDTDLVQTMKDIKTDLALLPIGGTYTMDVVDAVRTVKVMKPKYAIPMHYNTFEGIKASPKEFEEKIQKSIVRTKAILMKPGESIKLI